MNYSKVPDVWQFMLVNIESTIVASIDFDSCI